MSKLLCPSYRCAEGSLLLGVVEADGSVAFASRPLEVSQEFVDAAREGRAAEKRFRFAGPCHGANCGQWTDGRCGIPEKVARLFAQAGRSSTAPADCAIRDRCRWFAQQSYAACELCPLVTTEREC